MTSPSPETCDCALGIAERRVASSVRKAQAVARHVRQAMKAFLQDPAVIRPSYVGDLVLNLEQEFAAVSRELRAFERHLNALIRDNEEEM